MRRRINDKRILVTGASGGIGRCICQQLAELGARVAVAARSAERLQELGAQLTALKAEVLVLPGDVTSDHDQTGWLDIIRQRWGGLDVLINNAGVASWAHFADSTEEILRQVMEVNFFGPVELIRKSIPLLTQGDEPAVVNVASMCGRRAMPAWPEYSASKFALCGMTEAFRGELARFDIDVLLVLPGLTRTGLHDHLLMNEGRAPIDFRTGMPPEKVAAAVVKALVRNQTETVVGGDARWLLRANRFFPVLVDWLIARRVRKLYKTERQPVS
jgi:short-subunit dehydrogenase